MSAVVHPSVTAREFAFAMAETGWTGSFELMAGVVVMAPPAGGHVSSVRGRVYDELRRWQHRSRDGGLVLQDVLIHFEDRAMLAPDLAWWAAARRPEKVPVGAIEVVPDVVIEILSPATRENDLGVKRETYERASAVLEHWIIDPANRATHVLAREGKRLAEVDSVTISPLLGIDLAAADLFGDLG